MGTTSGSGEDRAAAPSARTGTSDSDAFLGRAANRQPVLELAVATDAQTLARIAEPLASRGIRASHLPTRERLLPLDEPIEGYDVGLVYPPRLMEGDAVDALLGVPWVNGRRAVLTSRNKGGVIARLGAADLPVPETVMVSDPVGPSALREAFERIGPPVVVKPNSATRGIGVARLDDLDSFEGVADYLGLVHEYPATGDRSFLVQEFLDDARDYRVMVVDGAYAGAVERRLPVPAREAGRWKHNVHRDAVARGVDADPELRDLAERVAAVLGIDFLGVDLLESGGRVVVSETNARPTVDDEEKYEPDFYDRLAALIRRRADGATRG